MLSLQQISKHYGAEKQRITVLNAIDLEVKSGQSVALVGPSGAGKSTLLHIAGLLMRPDAGTITIDGEAVQSASEKRRTAIRGQKLGFIYQFHHLLADFTALENVMIPLLINGETKKPAAEKAQAALDAMNMAPRASHMPMALSGGEQQRVAIARAMVHQPKIILADEPTGNLDPETAQLVSSLLFETCSKRGCALLMVTHNPALAAMAGSIHQLA